MSAALSSCWLQQRRERLFPALGLQGGQWHSGKAFSDPQEHLQLASPAGAEGDPNAFLRGTVHPRDRWMEQTLPFTDTKESPPQDGPCWISQGISWSRASPQHVLLRSVTSLPESSPESSTDLPSVPPFLARPKLQPLALPQMESRGVL